MTKKKEKFNKYLLNREKPELNRILEKSNSYTHNKVFDEPLAYLKEEKVISVSPLLIKNWDFHDRPENELGNIDELAQEFLTIGQQLPCIVREIHNLDYTKAYRYELIAGERRWKAAIKANIDLKIIIKNLADEEAAVIQIIENEHRKSLSDFAKGMSYAKLISHGVLNQQILTEKLNISKQQVSRLLSFSKIPKRVIDAIGAMNNVSSRTAETIKQICLKGEKYADFIIKHSDAISKGMGSTKLTELLKEKIGEMDSDIKIEGKDSIHLFSWKKTHKKWNISFSPDISGLITSKKLKIDKLSEDIKNVIDTYLDDI